MEAPNSNPPRKHRYVLPAIALVIVCGLAAPFLLAARKHRQLTANETAVLDSLRAYSAAQDDAFKSRGAYATRFDELNLPEKFPELDDARSRPLHGYRFRILTDASDTAWLDDKGRLTKGYGLLAVPADYMITGRDTFLVNGHAIYVVDFNIHTAQITRELRSFSLPPGAQKVE